MFIKCVLRIDLSPLVPFRVNETNSSNELNRTYSWTFAFCTRAEIEHVIATIFQPCGRGEISARAETHFVIRLLENEIYSPKKAFIFLVLERCFSLFSHFSAIFQQVILHS